MALNAINGEIVVEEEERTTRQFRQFDVVNDDSDHYYLNWNKPNKGNAANGPDCFANASTGVHKKIMKEWKVLEKNLPESIYVRVYERRIDLLRAVIVGPAGTPYHDGLFFFDLAFPTDYPTRPPQVNYRSFGLRLNPNLYANGMVCLSLLNTWFGKRNEKWNPAESTVLQVLVSIQGLVLNKEPYFNEPGVGIFPGRTKKSVAYSENAFILSCKTMVYLLRRPPKNFEDFVDSHFRERASGIIAACNAYMDGRVSVGCYAVNGLVSSSSSSSVNVSSNFKATMKSWYPDMLAAFRGTGASLGNFVEQWRMEKETTSSEAVAGIKKKKKKKKATSSPSKTVTAPTNNNKNEKKKTASFRPLVIKKTNCGIRKVITKIKKILGLKKVQKKSADSIKVNSS